MPWALPWALQGLAAHAAPQMAGDGWSHYVYLPSSVFLFLPRPTHRPLAEVSREVFMGFSSRPNKAG